MTRSATSDDASIAIVSSEEAFLALRAEWNALAGRAAHPSVFFSHEWFDAAWQWSKLDRALHIMLLRRHGALAGILPLMLGARRSHGINARVLEFLTVPDTQRCDLICGEADQAYAAEQFARALRQRRGEWDMLQLAYLEPASVAATALAPALAAQGVACRTLDAGQNPLIRLEPDWDTFYGTRTRSLKKMNNLCANRLKRTGETTVTWLREAEAEAALPELIAISAASWKKETQRSLDFPGPQAFIRRLTAHAAGRGWASVWLLRLDGKAVAMEYQLDFNGQVHALRADFDQALADISPGTHLNRTLLETLFGTDRRIYLMGPGDNAYKRRWTDDALDMTRLEAFSPTWRGRWLHLVEARLKPRLKPWLRRPQKETPPSQETSQ